MSSASNKYSLGILAALTLSGACQKQPEPRAGTFRFAALGDAPYVPLDQRRFQRVLRQLNDADLRMVIHVGDILSHPCSDELFQNRLANFQSVRHPLVYTPGDNEWTDCHTRGAGSYHPLERLQALRDMFFEEPTTSLGATPIALTVQAADTAWAEFVENARWTDLGIVFATVHLVGSQNGLDEFYGRRSRDDAEVSRRTAAATAWLLSTFAFADSVGAKAVVIATHADLDFAPTDDGAYRQGFEPFLESLEHAVEQFGRPVLLIHGDSHEYIVDRPLVNRATGRSLGNFTRLEVIGSTDVGWVEVTVDTTAADPFSFTLHRVPMWKFW